MAKADQGLAAATAPAETPSAADRSRERRALGIGSGAHALHDGYVDILYVMLPLWQAQFDLSYAAVGALRSVYSGTMASLQIPATLLADRIGAATVLAGGTALAGLCYCLAGVSDGFAMLVAALFLGGLGAATQHPIASSLIARAFAGRRAITALGTYNFCGDLGRMALPALAAGLLWLGIAWRPAVGALGLIGLAAAVAVFILTPRFPPEATTDPDKATAATEPTPGAAAPAATAGASLSRGFWLLLGVGAIDSISRAAFMVFVPFLLIDKGASIATAGLMLTLIFVGGAAGKLVCAWAGARFGIISAIVITEILTAAGIVGMLFMPLAGALVLLPLLGIVLNGTSSLTYGSVPYFITPAQRNRAFGIFYTGIIGAAATAPTLGGLAGDLIGKEGVVVIASALALATLPMVALLRREMTPGSA